MLPHLKPLPLPPDLFLGHADRHGNTRTPAGVALPDARLARVRKGTIEALPGLSRVLSKLDDQCVHEDLPRPRIVRALTPHKYVAEAHDAWVRWNGGGRPLPGSQAYRPRAMSPRWAWPVNACPFQAGIGVELDTWGMFTDRQGRLDLDRADAFRRVASEHGLVSHGVPEGHPDGDLFVLAGTGNLRTIGTTARPLVMLAGNFAREKEGRDTRYATIGAYLALGGFYQGRLQCRYSSELADAAANAGLSRPRGNTEPDEVLAALAEKRIGFDAVKLYADAGVE